MMKKCLRITALMISVIMLFSLLTAIPVSAANINLTVKVDGEVMRFPDQKPVVKNNRTLVPVRFVAEELGYKVEWNQSEGAAVIDNGRIKLYVNTNKAVIDGKEVKLDVKTEVISERTMVPLRFVAENLNCTVDWVPTNSTILVNKRDANGKELSVFDRFVQTDLFWEVIFEDDQEITHKLYPKSQYSEAEANDPEVYKSWYIINSIDKRDNVISEEAFDCSIMVRWLEKEYIDEIAELLYIPYPTTQAKASDLMWKTVREQLWENEPDYSVNEPKLDMNNLDESFVLKMEYSNMMDGLGLPGTHGIHYLDNRTVNLERDRQCTTLIIRIYDEGYQPKYPARNDLTAEEIQSNIESCYSWDIFHGGK